MKHRTADLEGALLDAAVARAEGKLFDLMNDEWGERAAYLVLMVNLPEFPLPVVGDKVKYCPSSQWQVGGPIIERERIATAWLWSADEQGAVSRLWCAFIGAKAPWYIDERMSTANGTGPTPLIAAMRAYVASKFGEEVEIP